MVARKFGNRQTETFSQRQTTAPTTILGRRACEAIKSECVVTVVDVGLLISVACLSLLGGHARHQTCP